MCDLLLSVSKCVLDFLFSGFVKGEGIGGKGRGERGTWVIMHEAAFEVHAFGVAAGEKPAALFTGHGGFFFILGVGWLDGYRMVVVLSW